MSSSPPAPLRIALVSDRYHPSAGEIEDHVAGLAASLAAVGMAVTVLTHRLDGDAGEREEAAGVTVRRFLPILPTHHRMASPALARHLATSGDRYDLVHVHGHESTPAALAARSWAGPLVVTPHHHIATESRLRAVLDLPHRSAGRHLLDRAAAVVCTSATERRALLRSFPSTHDRAVVVTHGVDRDRLLATPPAGRADHRAPVLVAGRLDAYRRVDTVVSAMALLRPDHHLDICGDGPERDALEDQAARLGIADAVTFHGPVPDDALVRSIVSAACVVSLAAHETPGTVLLQAAAAGSPIVASAIDGHVEARHRAGDLVTLVPPDAGVRTVAGAIRAAAGGPRRPVELPSWSDVAVSTADVYRRVLARSPRSRLAIPA
jgi:glycosyltransferase involved in cell wall biosynthesis